MCTIVSKFQSAKIGDQAMEMTFWLPETEAALAKVDA
jgi:hypothetical protein